MPGSQQPTSFPVSTDPNYYLQGTGLSSLQPTSFTGNSFMNAFSPEGMSQTPVNDMATNPLLQMVMQGQAQMLKGQRPFNEVTNPQNPQGPQQ